MSWEKTVKPQIQIKKLFFISNKCRSTHTCRTGHLVPPVWWQCSFLRGTVSFLFFSKHSVDTAAGKVGLPGLTERGPILVILNAPEGDCLWLCASAGCLLSLCSLVLALLSFQQHDPFSLPIVFVSTTASVCVRVLACTCVSVSACLCALMRVCYVLCFHSLCVPVCLPVCPWSPHEAGQGCHAILANLGHPPS